MNITKSFVLREGQPELIELYVQLDESSPDELTRLKASASEIVRRALDEYFANHPTPAPAPSGEKEN